VKFFETFNCPPQLTEAVEGGFFFKELKATCGAHDMDLDSLYPAGQINRKDFKRL
jgi:hypothetical protein